MKLLDLFSGIGGFSLAASWAGIETAAFCEIDPFCQKVLAKNFPGITIYDDIHGVTKERLEHDGITAVDIISGGYPCQPFSLAGKRAGAEDDRHLWPEMLRIVEEIRPTWVLGENVAGHVTMGLDEVLFDLESIGYATQALIVPAVGVGANHRRYRVWVVANATGIYVKKYQMDDPEAWPVWKSRGVAGNDSRVERIGGEIDKHSMVRVDDGLSKGLVRRQLKALGNSIVPQVAYEIFRAMAVGKDGTLRNECAEDL